MPSRYDRYGLAIAAELFGCERSCCHLTYPKPSAMRRSRAATESRARDLDEIVRAAEIDLRRWSAARLYVTGGTGFVGTWLLRAFAHANALLETGIHVDVLSRDPERFLQENQEVAADGKIRFLRGDVTAPIVDGAYDAVIHAAATSGSTVAPGETIRTIVDGTRAVIRDVIAPNGAIPTLFISSGAIYGREPLESIGTPEEYCGGLDHLDVRFAYHESKRLAELCFAIAHNEHTAVPKIARLFAFLGPGLPLDAHFAAGNFIRDALAGGPIRVMSGGTAVRTYLYPTDMIVWCLAILSRGESGRAYNVGSDEAVTIRQLAERIAIAAGPEISVRLSDRPNASPETRYVPDVRRATSELGVLRSVDLDEAIERTIRYQRALSTQGASSCGVEVCHPP